jgi:predicted nuclease with TOPRIM domain
MFTQAKLIAGGIAIITISLVVWAGYTYVTNLQEKVEFQGKEITKLETANKTLTAEREQLKDDLKENKENQAILNEDLRKARVDKDKLIKMFSDHDFTKLVNKKPGLIEKIINKGTDKVFKELEDISNE